MVDAVDLPFVEMILNYVIKLDCALQIPSERLFDYQPNHFTFGSSDTGKPGPSQSLDYRSIQNRRHGKIKNPAPPHIVPAVKLGQPAGNRTVKRFVIVITRDVIQFLRKVCQVFRVNTFERFAYGVSGAGPEPLI
jgi:hypothetical protein